jgi:hypothetical protein
MIDTNDWNIQTDVFPQRIIKALPETSIYMLSIVFFKSSQLQPGAVKVPEILDLEVESGSEAGIYFWSCHRLEVQ